MRITIEPTVECSMVPQTQHKVIVETKSDDLNLNDVMILMSQALTAYGFSGEQVRQCLEEVANG